MATVTEYPGRCRLSTHLSCHGQGDDNRYCAVWYFINLTIVTATVINFIQNFVHMKTKLLSTISAECDAADLYQ